MKSTQHSDLRARVIDAISRHGRRWTRRSLLSAALILSLGVGLGHGLASLRTSALLADQLDQFQSALDRERAAVATAQNEARQRLDAMILKLAELQGRSLRLDAVGARMADMAGLDADEFDFDRPPGLGGPAEFVGPAPATGELDRLFGELNARLDAREQQLRLLSDLVKDRNLERESTVAGTPVARGWLSSPYGYRVDPFNGRRAWHGGVDFAGPAGTAVVAVAAGVVTLSGRDGAYGNTVEIDHGDGLVTRYSHNRENLVTSGDLVKKGQPIATLGRTGRASGPHVHFEVSRNGRSLDPAPYIQRAGR